MRPMRCSAASASTTPTAAPVAPCLYGRDPRHAPGRGSRAGEPLYVTTRMLAVDDKRAAAVPLRCTAARRRTGRDRPSRCTCMSSAAPGKAAPMDAAVRARLERDPGGAGSAAAPPRGPRRRHAGARRHAQDRRSRRSGATRSPWSPAGWWRSYGFEQATVARIAREAGYTTGMVAHYFDSKQDIILAALRLILRRIEERLTRRAPSSADLLDAARRGAADRRPSAAPNAPSGSPSGDRCPPTGD